MFQSTKYTASNSKQELYVALELIQRICKYDCFTKGQKEYAKRVEESLKKESISTFFSKGLKIQSTL